MFDVGFSELFIIAVVALLVLGPERLPKAARFAGLWVRKARAQWYSVKSEFEFEMAQEEMKKHISDVENTIKAPVLELQESLQDATTDIKKQVTDAIQPESNPETKKNVPIDFSSVVKPDLSDQEQYSLYDPNEKKDNYINSQAINEDTDTDTQTIDPSQGKLW